MLNKEIRNPKDSFSRHFSGHLYDEYFPKAILIKILRTKIAMNYNCIIETNFGILHDYSPTINRNNDVMTGVEETVCECNNIFDVKEHMGLGEEIGVQLNNGGIEKDWSLGHDYNHNYNWLEDLKLKTKIILLKTINYSS